MAEVHEASDGALGRRVAVKIFRGETDIATSQARQQLGIQALALIPTNAGQRLTRKPCRYETLKSSLHHICIRLRCPNHRNTRRNERWRNSERLSNGHRHISGNQKGQRGIQRIRHTHHLGFSFLRCCGLSWW